MSVDPSDYFTYKKGKIKAREEKERRPISKFNFLCQLFITTFVIIFIIFVVIIMKYSSKMDIEYTKGELQMSSNAINSIPGYTQTEEEIQRKIDKRLALIQQEENAPSEAKIVNKPQINLEVISHKHIEKNKEIEKQEKLEKIKKANEESEKRALKNKVVIEDSKGQIDEETANIQVSDNVIITSKLLVGRYTTFEEAKKIQNQIKANNPNSQPFVRKIGNVFSVQIGSYQDFAIAKKYAQTLRAKGFDVWIYQQ